MEHPWQMAHLSFVIFGLNSLRTGASEQCISYVNFGEVLSFLSFCSQILSRFFFISLSVAVTASFAMQS